MTKSRAFAIHLLISIGIFIVISAVIYFYMYPEFLFFHDGGIQGIKIVAGVDLVIGPLLTLILYKQNKKGLKFDLTCIASLQAVLLAVGCYIVYLERPISVVFSDGKFHTMSKSSYLLHGIEPGSIPKLSLFKPTWFIVKEPKSEQERSDLKISQLKEGPLYLKTNLYLPYDQNKKEISQYDLLLHKKNRELFSDVKSQNLMIFSLESRYLNGYLLVNKDSLEIIKAIR